MIKNCLRRPVKRTQTCSLPRQLKPAADKTLLRDSEMTDSTLNYVGALPHQTFDPATVETTYRKITLRLMSFLFFCWVLNYLDRVNISFAQLHLKHDPGLSDAAYGLGVSLFFIGYILLEVPSTLLLIISSLGQVGAFLRPSSWVG